MKYDNVRMRLSKQKKRQKGVVSSLALSNESNDAMRVDVVNYSDSAYLVGLA